MEKSIKRVEKLVHATNSALAEMKLSLMFDDMSAEKGEDLRWTEGFHPTLGEKLLEGDDLTQCQKEFKSETTEMLAKIEKMFGSNELSRKNAQALDKIKEINRKMKASNMEKSESGETQQSRQKLLSLLSEEKYSPRVTSSKGSARSKRTPSLDLEKITAEKPPCVPKKVDAPPETAKTPIQSKEELKSKILETQEIVDRGFQTALQLAHKVDSLTNLERKEKSPSPDKAASEINLKESEEKPEVNEVVSTVKYEKQGQERKRKRESKEKREGREVERQVNFRVINVKRKEFERKPKKALQVQHLPSLHIRGELQLQKVHSLEISSAGHAAPESSNTAVTFFSHEQMEKEKVDEMLGRVKNRNFSCTDGSTPGNYLECYHCGKLLRFRKAGVDPRKVDEILRMCNFNVFDPRIEEFVEKYGNCNYSSRCQKTQPPYSVQIGGSATPESEVSTKKSEEVKDRYEKVETENKQLIHKKTEKRYTLQNLSEQVCQKYKTEAATIAGHHLKLDTILQNLFRKVDESREFFESCHFLKNHKLDSGRSAKLTATKPVLVSLDGNSMGMLKKQKPEGELIYLPKERDKSSEVKAEGQYEAPPVPRSPDGEIAEGANSTLIRINQIGSGEPEPKKETQRTIATSSDLPGLAVKHREIRKHESDTKTASATQTCTSKSRHHGKRRTVSRKQNTEESLLMASRISKSRDWVFGQGEPKVLPPATADKRNATDSPEANKKEVRKENAQPDTSSTSSTRLRRNRKVGPGNERLHVPSTALASNLKAVLGNEEAGRKTGAVPGGEGRRIPSERKATSEASSEKSENNYESDFESTTNDPDEHGVENSGQEVFPLGNKLSTITEVDSELEKKLGDEPKTSKSKSLEANVADVEHSKQEEVSCKSKGREVGVLCPTEFRTKGAPMELVTSLRDILSALQEQFARTESLAEKLTENQKMEKKQSPELNSGFAESTKLDKWETLTNANLFENLQSARKDKSGSSRPPKSAREVAERPQAHKSKRTDSLSDEGGSSLGEILLSHRRKSESSSISENSFLKLASGRKSSRHSSARRESSNTRIQAFKLGVSSEDISYSEGEIPSENVLNMDRISIHSVGEIRASALTSEQVFGLWRPISPNPKIINPVTAKAAHFRPKPVHPECERQYLVG